MREYEATYHTIISRNIRTFRTSDKLSQEKLAEKLGCSREFVSRVENQKEKVSLKMILKIAEVFDINPSILFIPQQF